MFNNQTKFLCFSGVKANLLPKLTPTYCMNPSFGNITFSRSDYFNKKKKRMLFILELHMATIERQCKGIPALTKCKQIRISLTLPT